MSSLLIIPQDVNYREQSSGAAYMPCAALPTKKEVVLLQCESRLDVARFEELVQTALRGVQQVWLGSLK